MVIQAHSSLATFLWSPCRVSRKTASTAVKVSLQEAEGIPWNNFRILCFYSPFRFPFILCLKVFVFEIIERFSLDCRNWDWFWFWFWFYYALWLASVFTLVLVLRQSSENRSIHAEMALIPSTLQRWRQFVSLHIEVNWQIQLYLFH